MMRLLPYYFITLLQGCTHVYVVVCLFMQMNCVLLFIVHQDHTYCMTHKVGTAAVSHIAHYYYLICNIIIA